MSTLAANAELTDCVGPLTVAASASMHQNAAMHSPSRDSSVASSRREALFAAGLWLVATVYSVGYCAAFGYNLRAENLRFVLGMPDWVFWGIAVPWTACTVISIWFAMCVMRDEPLGDETASDPAAAFDVEAASCQALQERGDA